MTNFSQGRRERREKADSCRYLHIATVIGLVLSVACLLAMMGHDGLLVELRQAIAALYGADE